MNSLTAAIGLRIVDPSAPRSEWVLVERRQGDPRPELRWRTASDGPGDGSRIVPFLPGKEDRRSIRYLAARRSPVPGPGDGTLAG